MGAELLAPFAMWGAALGGAALLIVIVVKILKALGRTEGELIHAREDADALSNFQSAARRWRDLTRAERVKRLLKRARRKHRS